MNQRRKKQDISGQEDTRENIVILELSLRPGVIRSTWTTDEHSREALEDNEVTDIISQIDLLFVDGTDRS